MTESGEEGPEENEKPLRKDVQEEMRLAKEWEQLMKEGYVPGFEKLAELFIAAEQSVAESDEEYEDMRHLDRKVESVMYQLRTSFENVRKKYPGGYKKARPGREIKDGKVVRKGIGRDNLRDVFSPVLAMEMARDYTARAYTTPLLKSARESVLDALTDVLFPKEEGPVFG